jgi:hypothetical protein
MSQLSDIFYSPTFWTAVGSIAAVFGVIIAWLHGKKKSQQLPQFEEIKGSNNPVTSTVRQDLLEGTLEQIRAANGVRALWPLEVGKKLESLPNGVFGYIKPWEIENGVNRSVSLGRSKGGNSIVEIHKSTSGEIFLFGFVSQSTQVQLEQPSRTQPIEAHVFFDPFQEFTHLVPIHVWQIISCNHRTIEDEYSKTYELCDVRIK